MKPTEKLRALLLRYRRELLAYADMSSTRLALLMERMERELLRLIDREGVAAVTTETLNRVIAQTNRVVLEGNGAFGAWLRGELPSGALNGLRTQAEMLASLGAREATVSRIRETFNVFEAGIRDRTLLRLSNQEIAGRWAVQWTDRWTATQRALQAVFVRSSTLGSTWVDISKQIEGDLMNLDIAGQQPADAFARGFARAKLTEMATDTSIKFSQELGIENFVNIGVGDERQSTICRAASAQKPMTLATWMASEWGIPPRHVLNCRCDLVGVPEESMHLFEGTESARSGAVNLTEELEEAMA